MAPKLFVTGGTGYIGGSVLDALVKQHPEYEITALLRRVPDAFAATYPEVRIVRGDYDSVDVIEAEAKKADVVVHNGNSDHEPSIKALIAGLQARESGGFLIHLSGTGVVSDWLSGHPPGTLNPKIWSDIADIDAITSLPLEKTLHRKVDAIIQAAAGDKLKTAIICPPPIYGTGSGLGRKQTVFYREFWEAIQKVGAPFFVADGSSVQSQTHILDVVAVYLKLVEAAVSGGGHADWGKQGYYFTSTHDASSCELANAVGKVLAKHKIIASPEPVQVSVEQVDGMITRYGLGIPIGRYMFASNSRTRADRAKKCFGFEAKRPNVFECLEQDVLAVMEPGEWEGLDKRRTEW